MGNKVLGRYVAVLHRQEQKYISRVMKRYGLGYACYNFLLYLSHNEGASQKALCADMAIDEALAARVMKKLEEQGYVRRERKGCGRTYCLYLTEPGQALAGVLRQEVTGWWDALTAGWNEEHLTWLLEALPAMTKRAGELLVEAKEEKPWNK